MSAYTASSSDDLTQALLETSVARVCIERTASDDLTLSLLAKANHLKTSNMRPVVVCADRVALERVTDCFKEHEASFPELSSGCFVTMRDLCLRVLSDSAVESAVGRCARVLDENEHDVLMEDMKVSALKPRRLREMLKFFYRSMSDCSNEEDRWLITPEEQMIYAMLEENLEVRQAFLPCELPSVAYRGLQQTGLHQSSELASLVVLTDDFGALSKASQRLLACLAQGGMVVAGTASAAPCADEPYPCPEGFAQLAAAEGVQRVKYCEQRLAAAEHFRTYLDPAAEFAGVAQEVAHRIEQGIAPQDMLVAVPNKTWGKALAAALADHGIASLVVEAAAKIKGDPRLPERCADLKLAAFLKLYRDPSDLVALRSWIGMGDWLLCSEAFLELMAYAREQNASVADALVALRAQKDASRTTTLFGKFDAPLDELAALRSACEGEISCDEAVALFSEHGMPLSEEHVALLGDDAVHADLARLASDAFAARADQAYGPAGQAAVVIAPYRCCHGRHARVTFMTGLVNGFLPALDAVDDAHTIDHRARALARDRLVYDDVCSTAHEELVRSCFEQDVLEHVGALKMQMARVFVQNSQRLAKVAPSLFITHEV